MSPTLPSKSLIKLVDLAVIPAAILIVTKILTIIILNSVLGLSWDVKAFSDAFFGVKITMTNADDLERVISYSNLFMQIAALIGTILALTKLFYLHPKHVKPETVLKLAKSDSLHFIQTTFHLYHEAIVWAIFLVVADLLIVFNFIQGLTYEWVLALSIASTLFVVFMLTRSVDRDLTPNTIKYKND